MNPMNIVVPVLSIKTKIDVLKQPYYVISRQKVRVVSLLDKFQ